MARIDHPQLWMVLTEPWCGDSAQCLPCLDILAEIHAYITMRFLLRDDNLDIMDHYLTDGKRSIPLLVAFDPEGRNCSAGALGPPKPRRYDAATAEGSGQTRHAGKTAPVLRAQPGPRPGRRIGGRAGRNTWTDTVMILYQDNHWLAVDKPTGMATHAGKPGELGAVEWLELHLGLKTHVVSRLDRGTSGVLLLALDAGASARAQEIHESGQAVKIYEFYSAADSLAGGPGETWVREDDLDGKPAVTRFSDWERPPGGPSSATGPRSSRGRRHQIRRHAAASGVPILGDDEYGGARFDRLMLHCAEVRWPEIEAPIWRRHPASFAALAEGRRPGFRRLPRPPRQLAPGRHRRLARRPPRRDPRPARRRRHLRRLVQRHLVRRDLVRGKADQLLLPVLDQVSAGLRLPGGVDPHPPAQPAPAGPGHRDPWSSASRPRIFSPSPNTAEIRNQPDPHPAHRSVSRSARHAAPAGPGRGRKAAGQPLRLHLFVFGGGGRGRGGGRLFGGHGPARPEHRQDQLRAERPGGNRARASSSRKTRASGWTGRKDGGRKTRRNSSPWIW